MSNNVEIRVHGEDDGASAVMRSVLDQIKAFTVGNLAARAVEELGGAITAFAKSIPAAGLKLEALQEKLDFQTNGNGTKYLNELRALSLDVSVSLDDLAGAASALRAAGMDASEKDLRALASAADALDVPAAGLAASLAKLKTSSDLGVGGLNRTLQMLRAEGIPVLDILREHLHLTESELADLEKSGVSASQVIRAVLDHMGESQGPDKLNDKLARAKNAWDELKLSMGESFTAQFNDGTAGGDLANAANDALKFSARHAAEIQQVGKYALTSAAGAGPGGDLIKALPWISDLWKLVRKNVLPGEANQMPTADGITGMDLSEPSTIKTDAEGFQLGVEVDNDAFEKLVNKYDAQAEIEEKRTKLKKDLADAEKRQADQINKNELAEAIKAAAISVDQARYNLDLAMDNLPFWMGGQGFKKSANFGMGESQGVSGQVNLDASGNNTLADEWTRANMTGSERAAMRRELKTRQTMDAKLAAQNEGKFAPLNKAERALLQSGYAKEVDSRNQRVDAELQNFYSGLDLAGAQKASDDYATALDATTMASDIADIKEAISNLRVVD